MEALVAAAPYIYAGSQVVSAYGQYETGKIQQKMYNMKARQALLRSDQEALNEKRKGVQVLEKIAATQAAINARSGAGAIDPYSGTPQGLRVFATAEGMQDFQITRENAALATLGQAAFGYYQLGGATPGTTTAAKGSVTYGQGTYFTNSGMGGIT